MKCNGNYSIAENFIWFDFPLRPRGLGAVQGKIERPRTAINAIFAS